MRRGYPAPAGLSDVFIPGTSENEVWTRGTGRILGAIGRVFNNQSSGGSSGSDKPTALPQPSGSDAASLPPNGPDGPDEEWQKNQTYENASYHNRLAQAGLRGVKSPAPKDGAAALQNSYRVSYNAPRIIGVDRANREFVVLDRTREGVWHGHVRTWYQLSQAMRNALIRNRITNPRGDIIIP